MVQGSASSRSSIFTSVRTRIGAPILGALLLPFLLAILSLFARNLVCSPSSYFPQAPAIAIAKAKLSLPFSLPVPLQQALPNLVASPRLVHLKRQFCSRSLPFIIKAQQQKATNWGSELSHLSQSASAMSTTSSKYAEERRIAQLAVERAALLTEIIQGSHVKGTMMKSDDSPVTIADLGAQALIIAAITHAFPEDSIVGEEDAQYLRESKTRRDLLWEHVSNILADTRTGALSPEAIGTIKDEEEMMSLIEKGNHEGGNVGRIWALDPVDGTKGFLRGDQYAVCLGLIVDGKVVVGAISCPNLLVDPNDQGSYPGVTFTAEIGQGSTRKQSYHSKKEAYESKSISMNAISSLSEASFCEGVEAGHSSHDLQGRIAARLGITKPSVRMDSQAKYVSVARGDGDIYLRLPTSATYREKIWDHAAGSLIVEEAGGKVSDMYGKPLNFGLGRTLKENQGIIAAYKEVHAKVIEAVQAEMAKSTL